MNAGSSSSSSKSRPTDVDWTCSSNFLEEEVDLVRKAISSIKGHLSEVDDEFKFALQVYKDDWLKAQEKMFVEGRQPSGAAIFFVRCVIEALQTGSLTEREIKSSTIQACKDLGIKCTGRGTIAGLSLDVFTVCSVLHGIGFLDVDSDMTSTVVSNKSLSDRRKQFLSNEVDLNESSETHASGETPAKNTNDQASVIDDVDIGSSKTEQSAGAVEHTLEDISGSALLVDELGMLPNNIDCCLFRSICSRWKNRLESYFENARVLHKLSTIAAAAKAAALAEAAVAAAGESKEAHSDAIVEEPMNAVVDHVEVPRPPESFIVPAGVPFPSNSVPCNGSHHYEVPVAAIPHVRAKDALSLGCNILPYDSFQHSSSNGLVAINGMTLDDITAKLLTRQPVDDEHMRTHSQLLSMYNPCPITSMPADMSPYGSLGPKSALNQYINPPVKQKEVVEPIHNGPRVVKRASNQRSWKLLQQTNQDYYNRPAEVLADWANVCYEEAVALETEEFLLRKLAARCGILLKEEPYRIGTKYLTQFPDLTETRPPELTLGASAPPVAAAAAPVSPVLPVPATTDIRGGVLYTAAMLLDKVKRTRSKGKRRASSLDLSSFHAIEEMHSKSKKSNSANSTASAQVLPPVAAVSPQILRRISSPLYLRNDYAQIDKNPFAKSIFASVSSLSSPVAPIANTSASIILPDLIVKTSPMPWKQVAAEFTPIDNEDVDNPLFAISFSPRDGVRSDGKSVRRSSSIGSMTDDLLSPNTPASPFSQSSGRKSTEKRKGTEFFSAKSPRVLSNPANMPSNGSKDRKIPLVIAPNFREISCLRRIFESRDIQGSQFEPDGVLSQEDEDISDEAFFARHETVLKSMREKWAMRQKMKLEQKGLGNANLSRQRSPSSVEAVQNMQVPFNVNGTDAKLAAVVSPRRNSIGGFRNTSSRKRGRPPKQYSTDFGRYDDEANVDEDEYAPSTPHVPNMDSSPSPEFKRKFGSSSRVLSTSSIGSLVSANSSSSPTKMDDVGMYVEDDR